MGRKVFLNPLYVEYEFFLNTVFNGTLPRVTSASPSSRLASSLVTDKYLVLLARKNKEKRGSVKNLLGGSKLAIGGATLKKLCHK